MASRVVHMILAVWSCKLCLSHQHVTELVLCCVTEARLTPYHPQFRFSYGFSSANLSSALKCPVIVIAMKKDKGNLNLGMQGRDGGFSRMELLEA